jgi:hypothetical protein
MAERIVIKPGTGWFDTKNCVLYTYDGTDWVPQPKPKEEDTMGFESIETEHDIPTGDNRGPTEAERRQAVMDYCAWELGDREWGRMILKAYDNPSETQRLLQERRTT